MAPFGFMNVTQCVFCCLPLRCPKSGRSGVSARICETGISSSHHLKIKTPSGRSTRKHSENPRRSSSRQSPFSVPYFRPTHPVAPLRSKCGGSNTTSANVLSGNGRSVKSAKWSGSITSSRLPPLLEISGSVCRSRRLSTKVARLSFRSNQNIRLPQQASSTGGNPNTAVKSDSPPAAPVSSCAHSNIITPFQFRGAACRLPLRYNLIVLHSRKS